VHPQIAGKADDEASSHPAHFPEGGLWQFWAVGLLCCCEAHVCTPRPRPSDVMHVSAVSTWLLVLQPLTSKPRRRFSFCHNHRTFICTSMLRHLLEDGSGVWCLDNRAHHRPACICFSVSLLLLAQNLSWIACSLLGSDKMSRFPRRCNAVRVLAMALSALLAPAQRGTRISLSSLHLSNQVVPSPRRHIALLQPG
jgi:hypothetical protein